MTGATTAAAAWRGGGFGLPMGGGGLGIGTIIVLGLVGYAFGIDPRILIGGAEILTGGSQSPTYQTDRRSGQRKTGAPTDEMGSMISGVLGEIDDRWSEIFQASGQIYTGPRIVLFRNATNGGRCGMAQSAMGPFYCPPDQQIFLDTGFFREVETRFRGCSGSACKFTAAYIIAHEAGHHIQNLLGILPRVTRLQQQAGSKAEANALQVKVELQADCLSGVWVNREEKKRPGFLEAGDIDAALTTATAIGDDTLQRQATGRVVPDSFTHGSAAQRKHWFMTGYQQGTVQACNTLRRGRALTIGQSMSMRSRPKQFVPLNIAVLTISDTRSLADDKSGTTLADRLTAAGHQLAAREIVTDDVEAIRVIVKRWIADAGVDAIITTGGTGFTGRDVTPEAIEPLFEKRMDGFSIAFHMLSHAKIGASTMQSRATAGVAGATFIFCLPGSPGACRDGWDGILARQLDYRTRPCNFVEIMPRLDEHLRAAEGQGRVGLTGSAASDVNQFSSRSTHQAASRFNRRSQKHCESFPSRVSPNLFKFPIAAPGRSSLT